MSRRVYRITVDIPMDADVPQAQKNAAIYDFCDAIFDAAHEVDEAYEWFDADVYGGFAEQEWAE